MSGSSVHAGRTYEDFVIANVVGPVAPDFVRPVSVNGFKVDIGLAPDFVVECKNRLDSHQSHRAAAVAFALRHYGWRGTYIVIAPCLPNSDTTDAMVLDSAVHSKAVSHVLCTGSDPTFARIELATIYHRYLTCVLPSSVSVPD